MCVQHSKPFRNNGRDKSFKQNYFMPFPFYTFIISIFINDVNMELLVIIKVESYIKYTRFCLPDNIIRTPFII